MESGQTSIMDEESVSANTRWNLEFAEVAENLCPTLQRWTRVPQRSIRFEHDEAEYFGLRPVPVHSMVEFPNQSWGRGDEFILDFGIHMVGYLSMRIESRGSRMDAPCRLRLTFGETPFDVTMGMDNVQTWISTSWLPDEIVNIDYCPDQIQQLRRQSFRYLRVQIIDTSPKYKVSFSDIQCVCESAIDQYQLLEMPRFKDPLMEKIDQVSIFTLRDCMQRVFEDGPRRDRRLWLGDLRLQALANYRTFKNLELVKRCIYQFAAVVREDDSLPACLFDYPSLEPSDDYIVDYDALFAATVHDYIAASGDDEAALELWPTVVGCLKRGLSHLNPETHVFETSRGEGGNFLDWKPELDRNAGSHGVLLYCLKAASALASHLGKSFTYEREIPKMEKAAKTFLSSDELFISGPDSQVSFASAAWLTLSDAFPQELARQALLNTLSYPEAVRPLTPYLWHHVCDALAEVGCYDECLDIMKEYWGGMVEAGADTFWECYDPNDPKSSPYGDVRNNSFCHAWSCTPSYLLRGKLREFVTEGSSRKMTMRDLDRGWTRPLS